LAEILKSQPPVATIATIATKWPEPVVLSQLSQLSQVVTLEIGNLTHPDAVPRSIPNDAFRHGRDLNGNPKTWTGRVVTLEAWPGLSDWERHGSRGKVWNGLTRAWEPAQEEK